MNAAEQVFLRIMDDSDLEAIIHARLAAALEKELRGPRVRPDALIVHPSATQADIDQAIADYAQDPE